MTSRQRNGRPTQKVEMGNLSVDELALRERKKQIEEKLQLLKAPGKADEDPGGQVKVNAHWDNVMKEMVMNQIHTNDSY